MNSSFGIILRDLMQIVAWAAFTQLNEHAHRPWRTNSDPVRAQRTVERIIRVDARGALT